VSLAPAQDVRRAPAQARRRLIHRRPTLQGRPKQRAQRRGFDSKSGSSASSWPLALRVFTPGSPQEDVIFPQYRPVVAQRSIRCHGPVLLQWRRDRFRPPARISMPAPPLHASSRGAQARRRLAPRQYRPQRRRPRRRSTSIARSAIRGANSPGASSTAQVGVCDAIRPQTSLPTKRQARGPQSFQAQGMIATESVGVARSRLGSRGARAETGS